MTKTRRHRVFDRVKPLDERILIALRKLRNPGLTVLLKAVTHSGTGTAYLVFAAVLLTLNFFQIELLTEQRLFVRCMASALIAWFVSRTIKNFFGRERPPSNHALVALPSCRSFPSGHTASAVAFLVTLAISHHPYARYVLVWTILISFSRPYLGVHFPSDVLGGVFLGMACGVIGAIGIWSGQNLFSLCRPNTLLLAPFSLWASTSARSIMVMRTQQNGLRCLDSFIFFVLFIQLFGSWVVHLRIKNDLKVI